MPDRTVSHALRVRTLEPGDGPRWDAYVRGSAESHFGQLVAWLGVVERTHGCPPLHLLAEEEGRVRGVLPLFERRGREPALFSAPGGLLADTESVAAALLEPAREHMARRGLAYLELRDQRRAWPGLESSQEHVTMVLDLEASAEAQWQAFDKRMRNHIRKALKAGFTARWGHEGLPAFHRVMLESMRDLGTPIRGIPYFQSVLDAFAEAADILVIEREGEAAGTMFVVEHGPTLFDPWSAAPRRFFGLRPNHMLAWETLQRAIAKGFRHFDFGRSQWNSNTFQYKHEWGARPVPLYYQYALGRATRVPTHEDQKGGFALAVAVWKRLPLPVAEWLGEPAKRMFPEVL